MKRELNKRLIYECLCDERLKVKAEGSTRLVYTGFRGGLEHLKIETRLIDESLRERDFFSFCLYYKSIKRELS
jgi:hypothetical protein